MNILALNPGGNSLKAELVFCRPDQKYAFEGHTLFSVAIEGIGKTPELSTRSDQKETATEPVVAESYEQAAANLLKWWENRTQADRLPPLSSVDAIAVRVVHGARGLRDSRSHRC